MRVRQKEDLDHTPGIVEELINAMLKKGGKGDGKGRGRSPGKDGGRGNRSRGTSPQPKNKFIWSGTCWCCNEPGHKRDTCEKFEKILAANNGKKPEGHIGAHEKAKKAWKETKKKKEREDRKCQPHPKSMTANDNEDEDCENTEDEDSSDDDTRFYAMRIKPIHESKPTSTTNNFAALTSTDNDVEDNPQDDVATRFSSWAHKVKVSKKPLGRRKTADCARGCKS